MLRFRVGRKYVIKQIRFQDDDEIVLREKQQTTEKGVSVYTVHCIYVCRGGHRAKKQ